MFSQRGTTTGGLVCVSRDDWCVCGGHNCYHLNNITDIKIMCLCLLRDKLWTETISGSPVINIDEDTKMMSYHV